MPKTIAKYATPRLARQQGISGQKDAADARQEREQGYGPQTGKPHGTEGAPTEVEVRVAKVTAEEPVKNQNAKQTREDAQACIDEPENT